MLIICIIQQTRLNNTVQAVYYANIGGDGVIKHDAVFTQASTICVRVLNFGPQASRNSGATSTNESATAAESGNSQTIINKIRKLLLCNGDVPLSHTAVEYDEKDMRLSYLNATVETWKEYKIYAEINLMRLQNTITKLTLWRPAIFLLCTTGIQRLARSHIRMICKICWWMID